MAVLLIDHEVSEAIARLMAFAEANTIDGAEAIAANKKDHNAFVERMRLYTLNIPIGFRVTYSIERQGALTLRHISISHQHLKAPPFEAFVMLCEEFGMDEARSIVIDMKPATKEFKIWQEDIGNGYKAVNLVLPWTPRVAH